MFYVLEIAHGDSKIEGKGVYEYETLNEAIASFHKKMGTAMASELFADELCMVIGADGNVYKSEKFVREIVPTVEEPETEEPTEE